MHGSAREMGSRAKLIIVSLKGYKLNCATMFRFRATNNVAEYEALLASLKLAKEL